MDRSLKAAMLSALVFPGVGQLYLKRTARGMIFLLPALIASWYFANAVLQPVMAIAADLGSGALPFDPSLIQARVDQTRVDTSMMNLATMVLVFAWLASTIDAWLVGRAQTRVAEK
jgi:hypothetical protein